MPELSEHKYLQYVINTCKVLIPLGLVYTFNSEYHLGNLFSTTTITAIIFTLCLMTVLKFFNIKKYLISMQKSLFLPFLFIITPLMLLNLYPTEADYTNEIMSSTFDQFSAQDKTLVSLLNHNSQTHPENKNINDKIINRLKNEVKDKDQNDLVKIPPFDLMDKSYHMLNYNYELKPDYQKRFTQYEFKKYPKIF